MNVMNEHNFRQDKDDIPDGYPAQNSHVTLKLDIVENDNDNYHLFHMFINFLVR